MIYNNCICLYYYLNFASMSPLYPAKMEWNLKIMDHVLYIYQIFVLLLRVTVSTLEVCNCNYINTVIRFTIAPCVIINLYVTKNYSFVYY